MAVTGSATCHWHPDREVSLHCSRCGKGICVECMRQHPVGVRCKECARSTQLPTYQISPRLLARGLAAMVGLGIAGGIALYVLDRTLAAGFLSLLVMIGFGYAVGEGMSAAVNRRRGRPYQLLALGAVLSALGVSQLASLLLNGYIAIGLFEAIGGLIALVVAASRLQP